MPNQEISLVNYYYPQSSIYSGLTQVKKYMEKVQLYQQVVLKLCCLKNLHPFQLLIWQHRPIRMFAPKVVFLLWELMDDMWINRNHEVRRLISIHLVAIYIYTYIYIFKYIYTP